jgi:hypothetical protein
LEIESNCDKDYAKSIPTMGKTSDSKEEEMD